MPLLSLSLTQLLLAFVAASILHKLTFNRFFLNWLASHKFICLLVPSNADLKQLKDKGKKSSNKQKARIKKESTLNEKKEVIFNIPTADLNSLKLEETVIESRDLELINYSVDLEWIADLSLMSIFSFIITEVQFYFYPQTNECNFSLIWALLVIFYCSKSLWRLTTIYFKNEESIGERSICIVSGCGFLLLSMIILIANENHLEFGLEDAYKSFNQSATAFVKNHTLTNEESRSNSKPISFILVKFCIAILCSLTGIVFTFPGFRFGQLQKGLIDKVDSSRFDLLLCNLNYLAPLFVVLLWVKPVSRKIFTNQSSVLIDDDTFDTLRIYCIILLNLFRFYQLPKYVAMFLLGARNRVTRIIRQGGTTTNKELQITISSIYNFVNVVTIQYLLPVLMCLFTVIMFASLGNYRWIPFTTTGTLDGSNATSFNLKPINNLSLDVEELEPYGGVIGFIANTTRISTVVNLVEVKKIFSPQVFRGVFGFATWWLHFSWFCTTTVGLIYHTYFTH